MGEIWFGEDEQVRGLRRGGGVLQGVCRGRDGGRGPDHDGPRMPNLRCGLLLGMKGYYWKV